MTIAAQVARIAADAREASLAMARLSTTAKNDMLLAMAAALHEQVVPLVAENARDLEAGRHKGLSAAMLDRLMLDETRINGMADALREVAALPDPVGEVTGCGKRPNGLHGRQDAHPPGCDRHHLRSPPQRDRRCRGPVPQGRQCRHPAGRLRGDPLQSGHRRGTAGGDEGDAASRRRPCR